MNNPKGSQEIKIYQISKSFYELEKLGSNKDIIDFIIKKHIAKIEDFEEKKDALITSEFEGITYYSYVYNESQKESHWKKFLPKNITEGQNFEVQRLNFVLFASIKNNIFAVVGGGGMRVITRYINKSFGIDLYEYLASPKEDKIVSLTLRGISGKLTEQKGIYRSNQNLSDILNFTEIPSRINLVLRDELKEKEFSYISFTNENIHIEISSSFHIKQKVDFNDLHKTFDSFSHILETYKPIPLSSFEKEKDIKLIKDYEAVLLNDLSNNMGDLFHQSSKPNTKKLDIDFIHPSKLQAFYDCNLFQLKAKFYQKPFFETNDMNTLYKEGLKYIYDNIEDQDNFFEFKKLIYGIRVYGLRDNMRKTEAMFLQHITCEISYNSAPVFKIDNIWYQVKNNFIDSINNKCFDIINSHSLRDDILKFQWGEENEGQYNLKYKNKVGYYVFDKQLGNNIELCDIMHEDEHNIYLIHVKDGFDAKMRDVSNQITISASRFLNDISSSDPFFIKEVVNRYNKGNSQKIDLKKFIYKLRNKEIHYVLAYNSRKPTLIQKDRILKSKSNIAKYSLINCVHSMVNSYPMKIFDIADSQSFK